MNFNEETVRKYIESDDIEEYNLDELENDASFMIAVLKQSKDIKMEQFASENVKKNPKFVIEALRLCGRNISKMLMCAKLYLESASDKERQSINYKEIVLYIDKYRLFSDELKTEKLDDITGDINKVDVFIEKEAERIVDNEELKVSKNSKERFKEISENNSDSEIIKEHFARWYVYSIFHGESESLEDIINSKNIDLSMINRGEIPQFIINYIKGTDESLAKYLLTHMTFLNKLELEVNSAINRFNTKKLSDNSNDYLKEFYENKDFNEVRDGSHFHNYGDVDSESTYKY